jgi:hypothetical protein
MPENSHRNAEEQHGDGFDRRQISAVLAPGGKILTPLLPTTD